MTSKEQRHARKLASCYRRGFAHGASTRAMVGQGTDRLDEAYEKGYIDGQNAQARYVKAFSDSVGAEFGTVYAV